MKCEVDNANGMMVMISPEMEGLDVEVMWTYRTWCGMRMDAKQNDTLLKNAMDNDNAAREWT